MSILLSLFIAGFADAAQVSAWRKCVDYVFGERKPTPAIEMWNDEFYETPPFHYLFPLQESAEKTATSLLAYHARRGQELQYQRWMIGPDATVDDQDMYTTMRLRLTTAAFQLRKLVWVNPPGMTQELATQIEAALEPYKRFEIPLDEQRWDFYRNYPVNVTKPEAARVLPPRVVPLVPLRRN